MKLENLLLPLGILGVVALALITYNAIAAPLPQGFPSPTPEGKIEVKQYPTYRAATVRYSGDLSQAASSAFGPLYRHIESNDISMTAPVEARYPVGTLEGMPDKRGEADVSFLYRDTNISPEKIAPDIRVEDVEPMTVVSLGLRGSYDYDSYQQNIERLQQWLEAHSEWIAVGAPRRFFYDAPYVPDPLKRSEIQVPIRRSDR
jgi:hypothetical protein